MLKLRRRGRSPGVAPLAAVPCASWAAAPLVACAVTAPAGQLGVAAAAIAGVALLLMLAGRVASRARPLRNCLAHRRGIVDTWFLKACGTTTLTLGEPILLTSNDLLRYYCAADHYAMTVLERVKMQYDPGSVFSARSDWYLEELTRLTKRAEPAEPHDRVDVPRFDTYARPSATRPRPSPPCLRCNAPIFPQRCLRPDCGGIVHSDGGDAFRRAGEAGDVQRTKCDMCGLPPA
jgi:hypothetical protein